MSSSQDIPTIMVAFGVTGDLMKIKILPALFELYRHQALPTRFRLIGFSRKEWTNEQFRDYIHETIAKDAPNEIRISFLESFQFEHGDFSDPESYVRIKHAIDTIDATWGTCSNKLFYLAVAPTFYQSLGKELNRSGLTEACAPEEGWTHVVIEKPFGESGGEARRMETLLNTFFKEAQIYRIDHYLAKEMLQNIFTFRFTNNLFATLWDNTHIESIHINLFEKVGVEKRASFYDTVGALRDVGQNHLLEVLALLTMERPAAFSSEAIREKRAAILESLEPLSTESIPKNTFRAQYEGYRDITGVAPDSITETYFRVHASLATPKWTGVPIILESGKRLGATLKEIRIRFRHFESWPFPPQLSHQQNEMVISLEPRERPTEEYERLLLDCIRGDQTLFVSEREVRALWRYIDPIIRVWKEGIESVPLHFYTPDTKEILAHSVEE